MPCVGNGRALYTPEFPVPWFPCPAVGSVGTAMSLNTSKPSSNVKSSVCCGIGAGTGAETGLGCGLGFTFRPLSLGTSGTVTSITTSSCPSSVHSNSCQESSTAEPTPTGTLYERFCMGSHTIVVAFTHMSVANAFRRITIASPAVFDAELARVLSTHADSTVFVLVTGEDDPSTGQSCA